MFSMGIERDQWQTERYGFNLITYKANQIWNLLPHEMEMSDKL